VASATSGRDLRPALRPLPRCRATDLPGHGPAERWTCRAMVPPGRDLRHWAVPGYATRLDFLGKL